MLQYEEGEIRERDVSPEWNDSSEERKARKKNKQKRRSRSRSRKHRKTESKPEKTNTIVKDVNLDKKQKASIVNKEEEALIEEQNSLIDKQIQEMEIDEEELLALRRKAREELFKKYEEIEEVEQKEEEVELVRLVVDYSKQSYFKMLDQQREQKVEDKIFDIFCDEDDSQEAELQVTDQVDDEGKYYRIVPNEMIHSYQVIDKCGKGVFGSVCKATKDNQEVAIKIIRAEDIYFRSGERERSIIKLLNENDKNNKLHIIRLLDSFDHKKHLCMVFESLDMNLREAVKTYGTLNLDQIRSYAMQLFVALAHLKKHKIIHADIKPDNILISKDTQLLKLCDFGTAFTVDEATVVEYLVSRYYRAPEVIIGYTYDTSIDIWSSACTLFELYTGQFLFSGDNNNEMLKVQLQTMGKFSMKMLKRAAMISKYFDQQFNFLNQEIDPITKVVISKPILLGEKPTRPLSSVLKCRQYEDVKKFTQFRDLLEKCLQLDPKNRITPEEALMHPFINVKKM